MAVSIAYPKTPQSVEDLLQKSVVVGFKILPSLFPIILMIVAVKNYFFYASSIINENVVYILTFLVLFFLWSWSFLITSQLLSNQSLKWMASLNAMFKKIPEIYLVCFIYLIVWVSLFYLSKQMTHVLMHAGLKEVTSSVLSLLFFCGLPFLLFFLFSLFVIPILICEQGAFVSRMITAFRDSFQLMNNKYGWRIFIIYMILGVWLVISSSNTHHGHIIASHHLTLLFDIVVFSFFLPFFNVIILFIKNDLQVRKV